MRQLTITESILTAGGQQVLISTYQVLTDSIPETCIENYYQANKDNMHAFVENSLYGNLIKFCPATQSLAMTEKLDYEPVSFSLKG